MENQTPQSEPTTTPDVSTETTPPMPASSKKIIQPTADTPRATVNVGAVGQGEAAPTPPSIPAPAMSMPTAQPTPAVAPTPSGPPQPIQAQIQEWQPSVDRAPFTSPMSVFIANILLLIIVFVLMTFAIGAKPWIVIAVLLTASAATTFVSIRAYAKDTGSVVLVSTIISVVTLVATILGSASYLYYYIKLQTVMNNYNSSSSRYNDGY